MSYAAEAQIVRELGKFLLDGSLYRGSKPVMWSPVEKTALAEAEIEYKDHTSSTIWVRFPIEKCDQLYLIGSSGVIWTTTPWTIPGNRCICYNKNIPYQVVEVTEVEEGSLAREGENLLVASELTDNIVKASGIIDWRIRHENIDEAVLASIASSPNCSITAL